MGPSSRPNQRGPNRREWSPKKTRTNPDSPRTHSQLGVLILFLTYLHSFILDFRRQALTTGLAPVLCVVQSAAARDFCIHLHSLGICSIGAFPRLLAPLLGPGKEWFFDLMGQYCERGNIDGATQQRLKQGNSSS